jgi:hypothetical protein
MRLFSRSADAIVGRFFEGATAMEQTYTRNSFYGSVPPDRNDTWSAFAGEVERLGLTHALRAHVPPRAHAGVLRRDASGRLTIEDMGFGSSLRRMCEGRWRGVRGALWDGGI